MYCQGYTLCSDNDNEHFLFNINHLLKIIIQKETRNRNDVEKNTTEI